MPDESVNCCVTSPPYWGLRDYGTAKWEGGQPECRHKPEPQPRTDQARNGLSGGLEYMASQNPTYRDICGKCGARRIDAQLGLERTPEEYVARLVEVFREARRVLRNDATLWLNLGDSYAGSGRARGKDRDAIYGPSKQGTNHGTNFLEASRTPDGLKTKDLVGIPWRVAFALQADGWYLRSDIIWHKPNPMPESVTDRPTKAHEYLFLLSKSESYYYDAEAIQERASVDTHARIGREGKNSRMHQDRDPRHSGERKQRKLAAPGSGIKNNSSFDAAMAIMPETRNKRSVWTINTAPWPEAHFATFPPDLIRPCILAGCPQGGTVLDPFGGSGTTGMVAKELQCAAVLIELNPEYCAMAERRCAQDSLPLEPVRCANC